MDLHEIRGLLKGRSIFDIELIVTYYARVSTDSSDQLNSLSNQISYYEKFIRDVKKWTFVPGYVDEGLSGISTKKRENFHQMVADGKAGKFNLIITKEITRFARNTLDSILFTRELLASNVGVFFQNDNINTFDEDSELRLTIMSGIAQDELRKLSSRVKFGHQQAIKDGVVLGNGRMFGYDKDNGRLVINEDELGMVQELFELYATDNYSTKDLENLFWERGYRNRNGNKIAHSTLANMISNPKYKGYYVGNKVKVIDMFTKKQKFLPPDEWVMYKDETGAVPAIVSEELWDQANAILQRRSDDVKNRRGVCNHANLLTGKLVCTHCGLPYYRRESKDRHGTVNSRWVCSGKLNNGKDTCPSISIYESEIKPVLHDAFISSRSNIDALIDEYLRAYNSLVGDQRMQKRIEELKRTIELTQKKKTKLLEYNVTGKMTDGDFLKMNRQCEVEIQSAESEIAELEQQSVSKGDMKRHLNKMREIMKIASESAANNLITKEFIDAYIDKIYVTPEEDGPRLEIKLFTGDIVSRQLEKVGVRSGHIFLTM